jgi:hypothetical protein
MYKMLVLKCLQNNIVYSSQTYLTEYYAKHVASLVKCNKANVDAVVSSLFEFNWCCVDGIFPI